MLRFGGRQSSSLSVGAGGLVLRLFRCCLLRKEVCVADQNVKLEKELGAPLRAGLRLSG